MTHEQPTPAPVEVTQANCWKDCPKGACQRHQCCMYMRCTFGIAHSAPAGEVVELVEAVKASIEGWNNVVEMDLLPPQHHDTARALSERLHTALRQHIERTGE